MTVQELIDRLEEFPLGANVYFDNYDDLLSVTEADTDDDGDVVMRE